MKNEKKTKMIERDIFIHLEFCENWILMHFGGNPYKNKQQTFTVLAIGDSPQHVFDVLRSQMHIINANTTPHISTTQQLPPVCT